MTYLTYKIIWTKLQLISKQNLIASLYAVKKYLKTKTKSYGDEATDFHDKEVPKVNSIYTYLAVIPLNSTLKIESLKKVTSTISK